MTGGGAIWTIAASTAAGALVAAARADALDQELANTSDGPYRPDLWQSPPVVTLIVPTLNGDSTTTGKSGGVTQGPVDNASGVLFTVTSNRHFTPTVQTEVFVFDAVIRTEHQQRIEKTQQPIQNGANVSDHAFIMPARVVLEIGMSDAMDSYTAGQWTGDNSKSVNAYQTLKKIAKDRAVNGPLTITTRLDTYTNMLMTDISAPDTVDTRFGLRASIVFEELLTGTIASQQVTSRQDLIGSTSLGNKQGLPVPSSIIQQNQVNKLTTVPSAGNFSSNPTGS